MQRSGTEAIRTITQPRVRHYKTSYKRWIKNTKILGNISVRFQRVKVKIMQRSGTEAIRTITQPSTMQRSGTEAIRTITQPSKPKREITNITKSKYKENIWSTE